MSFTKVKYSALVGLTVLLTACGDSESETKSAKTLLQETSEYMYSDTAQFNFNANVLVDSETENPILSDLKITIAGAANNSAQRYEITPKVEAAVFNFTLPILLDFKKKKALIDPNKVLETIAMFAPQAQAELNQYKNKFIRFSPDNFKIDENEMTEAMTFASEAIEIGSGAMTEYMQNIPESSVTKLALNEKAKQLGAKTVLNVKLDSQQIKVLQEQLNTYLRDKVTANDKLPEEFKEAFLQGLTEAVNDSGSESAESVLYLNNKGQLVQQNDVLKYVIEGEKINVNVTIDYSNYGKANFTINPSKDQIVDFSEETMRSMQGQ